MELRPRSRSTDQSPVYRKPRWLSVAKAFLELFGLDSFEELKQDSHAEPGHDDRDDVGVDDDYADWTAMEPTEAEVRSVNTKTLPSAGRPSRRSSSFDNLLILDAYGPARSASLVLSAHHKRSQSSSARLGAGMDQDAHAAEHAAEHAAAQAASDAMHARALADVQASAERFMLNLGLLITHRENIDNWVRVTSEYPAIDDWNGQGTVIWCRLPEEDDGAEIRRQSGEELAGYFPAVLGGKRVLLLQMKTMTASRKFVHQGFVALNGDFLEASWPPYAYTDYEPNSGSLKIFGLPPSLLRNRSKLDAFLRISCGPISFSEKEVMKDGSLWITCDAAAAKCITSLFNGWRVQGSRTYTEER